MNALHLIATVALLAIACLVAPVAAWAVVVDLTRDIRYGRPTAEQIARLGWPR